MSNVEMYRSHVEKRISSRNSFVKNTTTGVTVFRGEGKGQICCQVSFTGALGSEMHISSQSSVRGRERADKSK